MRLKKLFTKVFLNQLFIIIITIIILLVFLLSAIKRHDLNVSQNYLKNSVQLVAKSVVEDLKSKNFDQIYEYVQQLSDKSQIRITIMDEDGNVIADSEKNPHKMDNHNFRAEIIEARKSDYGSSVRYSHTLKRNMIYVAKKITSDDKIIGYVRTSYFQAKLNSLFEQIKKDILIFTIIIFLLLFVVAYFFTKRITSPINRIIEVAQQVASGNLNVQLFSQKRDEIGHLIYNFNNMISTLRESIADIKNQKNKIRSIVEAISEALWVIDEDDKIQVYNSSFLQLCNRDKIIGKNYEDVLDNKNLCDYIHRILQNKDKSFSKEIELDAKQYYLSSTKMDKTKNTVFLLSDITELQKVRIIKKDFVANASHELKTPLTSIKGFIETLEDEITDDSHKSYLSIIKRNIDRLVNITQDIITLNSLESQNKLQIEDVDLAEIVENVKQSLCKKINQEETQVNVKIRENRTIQADQYRMEQVFYNLIYNAIKYAKSKKIDVEIIFEEKFCKIDVRDYGVGIPVHLQSRLFERFFVVDASRSRQLGGTGLGLSIVKHIIKKHKGTIEVNSQKGKGTTFSITLPISHYANK